MTRMTVSWLYIPWRSGGLLILGIVTTFTQATDIWLRRSYGRYSRGEKVWVLTNLKFYSTPWHQVASLVQPGAVMNVYDVLCNLAHESNSRGSIYQHVSAAAQRQCCIYWYWCLLIVNNNCYINDELMHSGASGKTWRYVILSVFK